MVSRAARSRRCFFFEEPIFHDGECGLEMTVDEGVIVVTPRLSHGMDEARCIDAQRLILDALFHEQAIEDPVLLYWTPMALPFSRHLARAVTVYDCMDELAMFKDAPRGLHTLERELIDRADVMFTGGHSLFESKQAQHANVHAIPSSVDVAHFERARSRCIEPSDQRRIPRPRAGFFGVIDERMDLELVAGLADLRPDLHIVMLGPVVKVDPATLPQRPNIHWLGPKSYDELPTYLASWDVAIMPFARNDSTRFISPTKTPEYLAGGKPVVSTSIRDVVRPYGELALARIADTPEEFATAIDEAIAEDAQYRRARADALLTRTSWDRTWHRMSRLIEACGPAGISQPPMPLASLLREASK